MLVQGINTGSVEVHVKLQNKAWQDVPPGSAQLTVKEPCQPVYSITLNSTVERRNSGQVEGRVIKEGRGSVRGNDRVGD